MKNLNKAISKLWDIKISYPNFNPKLVYNQNLQTFMAVYVYLPVEGVELISYNAF